MKSADIHDANRHHTSDPRTLQLAEHLSAILALLGEDPQREGLKDTPVRAAKALLKVTEGYRQDPSEVVRQAIFEYAGSKMVVVRNIEFYSMCEHHILPFFGHITVGYIPDGEMIGLSKVARLVETFARRLQVQERLTAQIVHALSENLKTKGVIVVCEARHLCMQMRGVAKQDAYTRTVDFNGLFETDRNLRDEFFANIK